MLSYAPALAVLCAACLWGAVERWRDRRPSSAAWAVVAACVSGAAFLGVAIVLRHSHGPRVWMEVPSACRYTLRGC